MGIHLSVQGTRVWSQVWEDFICRGAASLLCHNYWARAGVPAAYAQQEKPPQWGSPCTPTKSSAPMTATGESIRAATQGNQTSINKLQKSTPLQAPKPACAYLQPWTSHTILKPSVYGFPGLKVSQRLWPLLFYLLPVSSTENYLCFDERNSHLLLILIKLSVSSLAVTSSPIARSFLERSGTAPYTWVRSRLKPNMKGLDPTLLCVCKKNPGRLFKNAITPPNYKAHSVLGEGYGEGFGVFFLGGSLSTKFLAQAWAPHRPTPAWRSLAGNTSPSNLRGPPAARAPVQRRSPSPGQRLFLGLALRHGPLYHRFIAVPVWGLGAFLHLHVAPGVFLILLLQSLHFRKTKKKKNLFFN